jgi:predicted nucleic acid-binding protein
MSGNPKLVYWDSSIFIAWITNEQRPDNEMLGVQEVINQVAGKQIQLVTSVIAETEIFELGLTIENLEKIKQVLRNPNYCVQVNVDPMVARTARIIRELAKKEANRRIRTPDALHIATAMTVGCEAMHSFDDRHMLNLNGQHGISVQIIKPPLPPLFAKVNHEENTAKIKTEEPN